jgi:hypothetical protein
MVTGVPVVTGTVIIMVTVMDILTVIVQDTGRAITPAAGMPTTVLHLTPADRGLQPMYIITGYRE